jgi:hypothetical protein
MRLRASTGLWAILLFTSACATSSGTTGGPLDGGGAAGAAASGGTGNGGNSGTGGLMIDGGGTGNGGGGPTLIYAHTDTTLFQVDPTAAQPTLTQLGDFDCVGGTNPDPSMTDIAVSRSDELWGIDHSAVMPLSVVATMVHCGTPIPLVNPNNVSYYALTFAPAGVLDPQKEVLVAGNTAGELWAIDDQGNLSEHGTFGTVPANDGNGHSYANAGQPWELSGDIVFLENGGSPIGYATVRDCPTPPSSVGCSNIDTLIEINVPALGSATTQSVVKALRGQIVKRPSCSDTATSYGSMYGIAAWQDKVFGFSRQQHLVEIDVSDGSACLLSDYPNAKFAGAGVTTLIQVIAPPPK